MRLWPHDYSPVYQTFNRIFDCRGHGWANLQAAHLNLPFDRADADRPEGEFGRLHAALRALLAIMPALSASTPVMDGRATGLLDNRLEVYRTNSRKIPAAAGLVIPEPVYTRTDYERTILQSIYDHYAPHDPEGTLRDEWANSRGCIARFSRGTIEVRVLDVQECPRADLAIVSGLAAVTRAIVEGRLGDLALLRTLAVEPLHDLLRRVIRDADRARVEHEGLLRGLDWRGEGSPTAGELWQHLVEAAAPDRPEWFPTFMTILSEGCLARRITRTLGPNPSRGAVASVYRGLARCLERNELFRPA
jgi:hypothetical protein